MTSAGFQRPPPAALPTLSGDGCLFEWDAIADLWRGGPGCAELLGCGGPPLSGEGALAAIAPQDRKRLVALRRALTPAAPTYATTLRLGQAEGEQVLIRERGCGFFDEHGRLARVVGTIVRVLGPERVAEALVQRLLTSPLIGLYIHDLKVGAHVFINPQFTRLTGYTLETLPGAGSRSFLDLYHPAEREAMRAHREALAGAADGETLYIEHRFQHADGHWGWCLSCDSVFTRDADGSVRHVIGTFLDASARWEAEAALAAQVGLQRQLASVAAAVPGVICSFRRRPDGSACFPYASARIEDLYGVSPAELARDAAPVFAMMHPEDVDRVRASIDESARTMTPWRDEFRVRRPGRDEIWVEGHSMPVRQADGSILWHGYISDVTERKRLEQALRDSEERFRLFMDNSPAIAWTKDEQGRHVYISQTYARRFGARVEDWLGKTDFELWPQEVAEQRWRNDQAVLAAGHPMEVQEETPNADGTRGTWLNLRFPFHDHAGGRYVAGIGVDVTDRRRAEQALQEASRRKDEFLVMLAHELRNPLTPIRNAAHIMRLLDPSEPRLRWVRDVIERQITHLSRLVDDLLDLSRMVRGEVALKREAVDLADLVRGTLEAVHPLIQAKGHRLEVHLPQAPVQLDGDPVRLSQVLLNLLDNAAKYTPSGGCIDLVAQIEGEGVVLRVRDNGPGIPADLLPLIFDPFQQGERPLDRAQGGLGIGLTLVRRLVELHGGRVEARSPGPGRGSTFSVWLPRASGTSSTRAARAPDPGGQVPPVRILVVDDDPAVVESTALWLELEGHQVRAARSGPEALEQAHAFQPQVVLLDIGLRGMDGYETAQRLRELPAGRAARLVAVTGYGHAEARARSRAAGFDGHLVKPVDPAALAAVIAAVASDTPPADS